MARDEDDLRFVHFTEAHTHNFPMGVVHRDKISCTIAIGKLIFNHQKIRF